MPEKLTKEFIKGVERLFVLGDCKSRVKFKVKGIELIPEPDFTNEMVYETLSPMVVGGRKRRE